MANLQSLLTRLAAQEHARLRVAVALRLLLLVGFSLPPVPHALRGPAPPSTVGSAAPSRLPSARSGGGGLGSWRDGRRGSTGSASSDELEEAKDGGSTPAETVDGAGSRRLSFGTTTAAATQLSAAAAALLQTPVLLSDLLGAGGAAAAASAAAAFTAEMVASAVTAVRDRLAASPPFPATLAAAALGAGVGAPAAPLTLSHSGSFATLLAQSQAGTLSLSRAFPMEAAFSAAVHHAASATAATPSSAGAPLSAAGMGIGGFASIASPGGVGGASSGAGSGAGSGSAAPRSPAAAASLSKSHSAFSMSLRGAADAMGGAGGAGGGGAGSAAAAAAVGLLSRTMSNPYASVGSAASTTVLSLAAFRCLSDADDGIGWSTGEGEGTEPDSPAELADAAGAGAPSAPPLQLHILVSGAARSTVLLPAAALGQLLTCLPSRLLRRYPGLASMVDAAAAAACAEPALLRLQASLQLHLRIEDVSDASVYAPLPAVATASVRAATRSCVAVAPCRIFAGVDFAEASTLALAAAAVTVRNALDVGLHLRVRGAAAAAPAVLAHGELRALRLAPYGASYAGLTVQALASGVVSPAEASTSASSSSTARAEGKDSAADGKADGTADLAAAFSRVAVAGSPSAVARVLLSAGARNAATGVISPSTLVRGPPTQDFSSSSSSSSSDASEAMALAVLDVMRANAAHVTDASDAAPPIALLPPAAFVPFSCAMPGPHTTEDLASSAAGAQESLPLPSLYEKSLAERRLRAGALQESMASDSTAAVDTSSRMLQLAVQAAFTVSRRRCLQSSSIFKRLMPSCLLVLLSRYLLIVL